MPNLEQIEVLLSTSYFPPVSYIALLIKARAAFLEIEETFPKQTYRNRCEIATVSGKQSLIIPVTKPQGTHTLTRNMGISYRQNWQRHHHRSIETAYGSSPFFIYYWDDFLPFFENHYEKLIDINREILEVLMKVLGITTEVRFTVKYEKYPAEKKDYRTFIHPKKLRSSLDFPRYPQVFEQNQGFFADLSILDLLFNLGPDSMEYLRRIGSMEPGA